jgi:hypothetical protein
MVGERVFDIDIEHCPHCDVQLKLTAVIEEPAAAARIGRAGGSVFKRREGQNQTGL